jgi:hypothetical protein
MSLSPIADIGAASLRHARHRFGHPLRRLRSATARAIASFALFQLALLALAVALPVTGNDTLAWVKWGPREYGSEALADLRLCPSRWLMTPTRP